MSDNENSDNLKPKKRSVTSLTLGWIADKVRRAAQIKDEIDRGTYKVDPEKVAASIVNKQE